MPKILSLDDGNQSELKLVVKLPHDWLEALAKKYSWARFDEYDNRVYEFMYHVLEPAMQKSKFRKFETLWNRFTRCQKTLYTLLTFDGQVKNGGVYQFLFNYPELCVAALESFIEIGDKTLKKDYEKTLTEFAGKSSKVGELKSAFNDQSKAWKDRWKSFTDGYTELKTASTIEGYFYTKKFMKSHFQLIATYVESNFDQMAQLVE